MTADDLRMVGYTVDDTTTSGTWVVTGMGQSWIVPADDSVSIQQIYSLALNADNITLRTQAEDALASLNAALASWDTLTDADFKAAVKTCIEVVVPLTRLTIQRYGG